VSREEFRQLPVVLVERVQFLRNRLKDAELAERHREYRPVLVFGWYHVRLPHVPHEGRLVVAIGAGREVVFRVDRGRVVVAV